MSEIIEIKQNRLYHTVRIDDNAYKLLTQVIESLEKKGIHCSYSDAIRNTFFGDKKEIVEIYLNTLYGKV